MCAFEERHVAAGRVAAGLPHDRGLRRVNVAVFKPLFHSFVLLCRRLDLFGRELVAVDGTNSRRRNFTQQKPAG